VSLKWPNSIWKSITLLFLFKFIFLVGFLLMLFKKANFIKVVSFKVEKIENSLVYGSAIVLISNSNFYSILGKDIQLTFNYNQTELANGLIENLNLPADKTTYVKTDFQLNFDHLSEIWDVFVTDSFPVTVAMSGSYTLFNVNYTTEDVVYLQGKAILDMIINEMAENQGLSIRNLRLEKLGLMSCFWRFDLEIKNNIPIDFEVIDIVAKVKTNEAASSSISSFRSTDIVKVSKASVISVPIALEVETASFFTGILDEIKNFDKTFLLATEVLVNVNGKPFKLNINRKIQFNPFEGTVNYTH